MSKVLHDTDDDADDANTKAIAILWAFSKKSQAKNQGLFGKGLTNNNILDWPEFRGFADNKMVRFVLKLFTKSQILKSSKLKEFEDDSLKFDEIAGGSQIG